MKELLHIIIVKLATVVTYFFLAIYYVWRLFFTIPRPADHGWVACICGLLLFTAEISSAFEVLVQVIMMKKIFQPELPEIPNSWYPEVDIFIATHNEDTNLLFKTANACTMLRYPDKSKVHVFLCDDAARPEVQKLAQELKIGYFGLKNNKLAKAGNLNNALSKTFAPLVATFDADMIPNSEFLLETVPFFFLPKVKKDSNGNWIPKEKDEIDPNEKVGFIQTPQSFYNPDLFQYNLYSENSVPNEQDYFFRHINIEKNRDNAVLYAGSNTLISREALERVGGIATGTITEDFETGIRIEALGYKCYAISKLVAKGLAPMTFRSLIKQRERWARGCIYSLRRIHLFRNKNLTFAQKLSYFACRLYWESFSRRLIFIMSPLVFVLFHIPIVVAGLEPLLLIWLPSYVLYSRLLKLIAGGYRDARWSNIIDTIMFPYLVIPIWAEILGIQKKKFSITSKSQSGGEPDDRFLVLPHVVLLVCCLFSLAITLRELILYRALGALIILYWLCINSYSLVMAILFINGRTNERKSERFQFDIPIEVTYNNNTYKGWTVDVSEGGLAFILNDAVYLPDDKEANISFTLSYRMYEAHISGHISSVTKTKDKSWKYSIELNKMSLLNKKQYLQIIFDREHTLPKHLLASSSYVSDISSNFALHNSDKTETNRKTARLLIKETTILEDGTEVKLQGFNFKYIKLAPVSEKSLPDVLVLYPQSGFDILCEKTDIRPGIYIIKNMEQLSTNKLFLAKVKEWEAYDNKKRRR
ncbi:MAG: glycosyltransferase [Treponema sp.]|nr:glycosyltransferase [Treponema sp.]